MHARPSTAWIENDTFFRAEVIQEQEPGSSDRMIRALTNPIYVKAGEGTGHQSASSRYAHLSRTASVHTEALSR